MGFVPLGGFPRGLHPILDSSAEFDLNGLRLRNVTLAVDFTEPTGQDLRRVLPVPLVVHDGNKRTVRSRVYQIRVTISRTRATLAAPQMGKLRVELKTDDGLGLGIIVVGCTNYGKRLVAARVAAAEVFAQAFLCILQGIARPTAVAWSLFGGFASFLNAASKHCWSTDASKEPPDAGLHVMYVPGWRAPVGIRIFCGLVREVFDNSYLLTGLRSL